MERSRQYAGNMKISTDELTELWDRESGKYRSKSGDLDAFPLDRGFMPSKGDRILDAGCGAGAYMSMFSEVSGQVYGVDISSRMVDAASRFGKTARADIRDLPFKSEQFDYVSSFLAINHFDEWKQGFSQMAGVLRKNGRMVLLLPNVWSFITVIRSIALILGIYSLRVCRHFTVRSLKREAQKTGLRLHRTQILLRHPKCSGRFKSLVTYTAFFIDVVFNRVFPFWGECLVVELKKTV